MELSLSTYVCNITNSDVYMMSTLRQKHFPTHYIYCYLSWLLLLSPLSSGNVGDVVAGAKECWPTRFGSLPRLFTPSSTAVQAQLLTIDDHHGHHCYQWLLLTWIIATSNHHQKWEMLWGLDQCDSGYWRQKGREKRILDKGSPFLKCVVSIGIVL